MSYPQQYQPTPELQKVLDQLTPSILNSVGLTNQPLRLRSFSKNEEDENQFTFFIEGQDKGQKKLYKISLKQIVQNTKANIQITQIAELIPKSQQIIQNIFLLTVVIHNLKKLIFNTNYNGK